MSSPTSPADEDRPTRRRHGLRVGLAVATVVSGVLTAAMASGASVGPVPFPGPTGCTQLAQRFGGGPYTEIRFSTLPAVGATKTATRAGVTVTVTRLTPSTMAWQASDGVDLVFVNAGSAPSASSAVYRYEPEATSDTGLGGINPSDVLDHVVVCFDHDEPVTTVPTTTTTSTTTVPPVTTTPPLQTTPTTSPPPTVPATTRPPIVRCANPPTCQIERVPPPWRTPPTTTPATTVVVPRLPETGTDSTPLALAGAAFTILGLATVALGRPRRRCEP